jgi:hypothetical protein
MAKVRNPTTFSRHFKVEPSRLADLGVTDITLAVDTRLFLDPLLIDNCSNQDFAQKAAAQYRKYFENAIKVLAASTAVGDVAWRAARRMFEFHEIRGTCLGYGAGSIDGSAWGPELVDKVVNTAKAIVDLGVRDPDIFPLLGLLEEGVGPDRISDMTTNVVLDSIVAFNVQVIDVLKLAVEEFTFRGSTVRLVRNPFHPKRTPVLLTPRDVLRPLPTASDWDGVAAAAAHNDLLRKRVNSLVAHLWADHASRDKKELRKEALASGNAFQVLLDAVKATKKEPYNLSIDPAGLLRWAPDGERFAQQFPLRIAPPSTLDLQGVHQVVRAIVDQFRQLVEANGLSKSLWVGRRPLPEKYAQRLFFTVAYCYCKQINTTDSKSCQSGGKSAT